MRTQVVREWGTGHLYHHYQLVVRSRLFVDPPPAHIASVSAGLSAQGSVIWA